jgi:hypothetical protein
MAGLVMLTGAGTASAQGADIFGVGGGHVINNKFGTFNLSAHSSPTRDFGHVSFDLSEPGNELEDLYVDVDCLNAVSISSTVSAATIGGEVRRAGPNTFGFEPGDRALFFISDGGNPSAPLAVDAIYLFIGQQEDDCKLVPPIFGLPPDVSEGNITIKLG